MVTEKLSEIVCTKAGGHCWGTPLLCPDGRVERTCRHCDRAEQQWWIKVKETNDGE